MRNIVIVGGGTAGLISALLLKNRLNVNVTIIKSGEIGIIGVGEGSTKHFNDFIDAVGISWKEIIKETDATLKLGVLFKNWTDKQYFHNVCPFQEIKVGDYNISSAYAYLKNIDQIYTTDYLYLKDKVYDTVEFNQAQQYHFNTFKLNDFLIKKCIEKNIIIIEDLIEDVEINEKGINKIKGKKQNYSFDFYIDCTGFKRLLIKKLNSKWISYSNLLKMNEAIAFPTEDTNEYTPYTSATAMDYGWMWNIPVFGRWGNGYIYDNNYINAEKALQEIEKKLNKKNIVVAKNIKFNPGTLEKVWIKNCMAVGLSANFVEPMEATSIGTAINQIFLFINYFPEKEEKKINNFNLEMLKIMNNIKEFVFIHYLIKKEETLFWKNLKNIEIPEVLKTKLENWKNNFPSSEDFQDSNYYLFNENNFINVLYGIQFFNKEKIKKEFLKYSLTVKKNVLHLIKLYYKNLNKYNNLLISHKIWLTKIKNERLP
jgi:flavin-dependent dehydrogenase